MVRPLAVVVLSALLSATAAYGDSATGLDAGTQAKPKPAAPRAPTQKPGSKPAPAAAKPEPPPPPPPPATDVRMKTASTQGAQISQNTTYLQGARQRVEFPGVVILDQCDQKRSVMLNTAAKKYRVQPYPEVAAPAASATPAAPMDAESLQPAEMARMMGVGQPGPPAEKTRGGIVTFTTTLSDTLERQTMFGLEARRIKTLVIKQSSNSACDKSPLKIEVDAWYVDLPAQAGCTRTAAAPAAPTAPAEPGACVDKVETRVAGDVKLGFPIKTVTTSTTGEGDRLESSSTSQEVTELEITRLDRALFDVPADYVEANSSAEIVPALATGGSLADALFGSTANGSSTAAPKKPGVIRIGILEPINKTARDLPPSSLRQDLVAKFNKAPYEAIPVAGTSPAAIEQAAASMQVDYLMLAEIVEAKTSKPGRMGGLTRMTGGAPKDSHEVKLDYKLYAVGATQSPRVSGNAKASNGGFGIGSALRLAAFAGQMYMRFMVGGMGMGMMNPMMAISGMGGLGPMGGGLFDPRASAMSAIFMGGSGGMMAGMGEMPGMASMGDPSEAAMRDTVSEALGNGAKAAMEQLGKKK